MLSDRRVQRSLADNICGGMSARSRSTAKVRQARIAIRTSHVHSGDRERLVTDPRDKPAWMETWARAAPATVSGITATMRRTWRWMANSMSRMSKPNDIPERTACNGAPMSRAVSTPTTRGSQSE